MGLKSLVHSIVSHVTYLNLRCLLKSSLSWSHLQISLFQRRTIMATTNPPPLATSSSPPPSPANIPPSDDPTEPIHRRRSPPMEDEHLLDVSIDDLDDVIGRQSASDANTAAPPRDESAPTTEQNFAGEGADPTNKSAIDNTNLDEIKARTTSKCQFDKGFHSSGNPVKPLLNIKNQPLYLSTMDGQRCASGAIGWDNGELFIMHSTALSSLVRGNVRAGDGSAHLGHNFPVSWTSSVSRTAKPVPAVLSCHCVTAKTSTQHALYLNHQKHDSKPLMVIVGDQYVPPVLGGNYRCAIILRMDSPTPATILKGVRTLFAGVRLPANSIVFLSFTSLALELRHSAFIRIALDLEEEIGRFFLQNRDQSIKETLLKQWRQDERAPRIINLLSPHVMSTYDISADLAAANHILLECYALRADTRLTDLADLGKKFLAGEDVQTAKTRVDAAAVTLPDIEPGILFTKPSNNVVVYGGFVKEDLPAVTTKFWWEVAAATTKLWTSAGLDAGAIPDMADCITGAIRDQVSRLNLDSNMPRLFNDLLNLDYGETRPLPERIQRSLCQQQDTKRADAPRDKLADVDVVLIGNSAAATIADKLKKLGLKTCFRSINPAAGRLTHKSADLFSSGEFSGQKCLVVVDAFSNSLLQPEDCPDGWLLDSEEKLQVLTTTNARGQRTFHKVLTDGRILTPISDASLVALIGAINKFCSSLVASAGPDLRVVLLGPLPRYPHDCCTSLDHKKVDSDAAATAKQIRDINYFISRSAMLPHMWSSAEDGILVLPFHQWASRTFDRPYNANGTVCPDNVHVTKKCYDDLAVHLKSLLSENFRSLGLPSDTILHQRTPSEWLQGLLELGTPLPQVEIHGPLSDEVAQHRGEKRKASSSAGRPPRAKGDLRDTFFHGRQSQPGHTPAQDRIRSSSRGHSHYQQQHHHHQQQRQQPGPSNAHRAAGSSRHHLGDSGNSRGQGHASRHHRDPHSHHHRNGGGKSGYNSGRHHYRDGRDKRR